MGFSTYPAILFIAECAAKSGSASFFRNFKNRKDLRHVVAACDVLGARTATRTPLPPVSLIVRKQNFLFLSRAGMLTGRCIKADSPTSKTSHTRASRTRYPRSGRARRVTSANETIAELRYTIRIDVAWVTAIDSFIDRYPLTLRMFSESQHQSWVTPVQLHCEVFDVKLRSSNPWLPHALDASSLLKNEGDAVGTVVLWTFLLVVRVDFPSNMIRTQNVGACDPTYAMPLPRLLHLTNKRTVVITSHSKHFPALTGTNLLVTKQSSRGVQILVSRFVACKCVKTFVPNSFVPHPAMSWSMPLQL